MIHFSCECGKQLQAGEEKAGQQAICPVCGRRQLIPCTSAEAARPDDAARPPPHSEEKVQRLRPALPAPPEGEAADEGTVGTSGKATISLVLGIASLFFNVLTGLPAVLMGILALQDIGRSGNRLGGQTRAIVGIFTACVGTLVFCSSVVAISLLGSAIQKVKEAMVRASSMNNLAQISLAMHNYQSVYGRSPPRPSATRTANRCSAGAWPFCPSSNSQTFII